MKNGKITNSRNRDELSGYRKTRHTVYRSYHYLIWKLKDIDDHLLRSDQARRGVEEAVKTVCRERGIHIEELAVGKESVHLVCSIPPKYAVMTVIDELKNTTATRLQKETLGLNEYPWSDDFFSQTIGYEHLEEAKEMARNREG